MHDPLESRYQPPSGSLQFRYTIGSLLLATFCFAVLIATTHQLGRSGVAMALFVYYLVLPSLFVAFVEVSLRDLENSVASRQVFGFFVVAFVLMFFACGLFHESGTFAACWGPIFLWPPQLFAIVALQVRKIGRDHDDRRLLRKRG